MFVLDLHAAAHHAQKVGDDLTFEDARVVGLEAVENFAAHRHDALKFRVARELDRAHGGIALDDVKLALFCVAAAAVDEFLHTVGDVQIAGEFLLDGHAGALGGFAAALVDEHLLGDLVRLALVFNKIDLQTAAEKLRHGLLNELVVDGFFRLVFVGGLCGEAVCHQHEAVSHVLEGDLGLVFDVLAVLLQIGVDGVDEGVAHGLVRCAAVLQP